MSNAELLAAYMAECFPSMREDSITDPEGRKVWIAKARKWYADKHATGFRAALVEFRRLQGYQHWSRETTLKHAMQALRHAGILK